MKWDGSTLYQSEGTNGENVISIPTGGILFDLDTQGISLRDGGAIITWDELHSMLVEPPAVPA